MFSSTIRALQAASLQTEAMKSSRRLSISFDDIEMVDLTDHGKNDAIEEGLQGCSRESSYNSVFFSRAETPEANLENGDSDAIDILDEGSEKGYEAGKENERQQLIPAFISAKKSSFIPSAHGNNPYTMSKEALHTLRMGYENLEGTRIDNVRYYDLIAMLSKNLKYIRESKQQLFIDCLKTLEGRWRDANKPREAKKNRHPHPKTPADFLKLLYSLKLVEPPKPTMAIDDVAPRSAKPSKLDRRAQPNRSRKQAKDNAAHFLEAARGTHSARKAKKGTSSATPKAILSKEEERKHPWMPSPEFIAQTTNRNGLLLRAWDQMSQCRINDHTVGFLSGASWFPLGDAANRHRAISAHANWGSRIKTPFISTTTSFEEIVNVRIPAFTERQTEAGIKHNTKLTIINAHARLAKKFPTLKMTNELDYYRVQTPYGNHKDFKNSFFNDEYLLLFRSEIDEIVATWCWQDVERTARESGITVNQWFRNVAVPLYDEHEAARKEGRPMKLTGGCSCCGH